MNVLLIDIGGTNYRYAYGNSLTDEIQNISHQSLKEINGFEKIFSNLLELNDNKITHSVISIAGPRVNNSVTMTNRNFHVDANKLKKKFNLDSINILNDWEAIGYSFLKIKKNELLSIKEGSKFNNNSLFFGPGTGLGSSLLIDNKIVLPSEIGNTNFMVDSLLKNYDLKFNKNEFTKLEDLMSGPGLSKIFKALYDENKTSQEIFELAKNNDKNAVNIIESFVKTLANILADLSLIHMPGNGIYLIGSLVRSLHELIDKESFRRNFLSSKGSNHLEILNLIKIDTVNKRHLALYGNLNYFNLVQKDSV